ncbi:UDP-GlcNAc:betaGal beta-1,3-N-acetylglucosaminyltransferase-like protein 1 [Zootermopsis nevadensis]|uniref:UDP-GlcNAc:betaGal beta-1,3-N-acetylglucosaminyltransferase-like protein 1 n=1 Tax=Zootermopsis nevadensis TaxID=136037 RepID=A0A067QNK3_ZOONE|nr:UDP-GlcNAc:betaGal beta-1,3-N-acetylglucosaminyltransferase-like protein 1 [Zootermopsis nevadensis]KDR09975.1 UDP-GlcNAc:betaGal beta-1,3-N-acetylglucosaminyltransferase-like protein 1 [Zootermopsis nevadensis]
MELVREKPDISVIIPVHNGEVWIEECFKSIQTQTAVRHIKLEVSVYDDASTDRTWQMLQDWGYKFNSAGIKFTVSRNESLRPRGVGYAKNRSVKQSTGHFLCFQDVDDIMLPDRILHQYEVAKKNTDAIVGCGFCRLPADSTARFTRWANSLDNQQLYHQLYTSHGPTLVMPTWFCGRDVFDRVGGFSEEGKGTPEDLIFFYGHLDKGGKLCKVPECLLVYRYHQDATTFSIHESTIWSIRLARLQERVLNTWPKFSIWNAGKQGRRLYRSLHPKYQDRVVAFCDVDVKKVGKMYSPPNQSRHIPIIHFTQVKPPVVICVKLDLTGGSFEENLKSLKLQEGTDYIHFS